MYRFLLFLKKILFVLLFAVIEAAALHYYAGSSSYNQAKLINASNRLAGGVYAGMADVRRFSTLGRENRRLTEEVASLRAQLDAARKREAVQPGLPELPFAADSAEFVYRAARVIKNSLTRSENFITLNRGADDGIEPDMAILTGGAIAGYVLHCNARFSVAMSVLNTKFRTSGRILGTDYFGSVYWDGHSYDEVMFTEVPKYAELQAGDTIVTTDYSAIFPPDMLIGTVVDFELFNGTYYNARLKLFANMGSLNNVVLAGYRHREERRELEERTERN